MSKYPTQIDSDAELPRVDDNLSETSVETINALREAVIAVEKAIGANPQGSAADLVQRLSVFFNEDGTAKASALVAAGLIALPITNAMIASNAGILESKLDLDFATQVLQNEITSNDVDIANLQQSIIGLLASYAGHINGLSDKHDGYAILLDKLYPSSTPPWLVDITAVDVSSAIAAINNNFLNHIALSAVGTHPASAISLDASNLQNITSDNLQGAIEQIDQIREVELIDHRDDMHANGLSLWANSSDGYSVKNQIIPQTVGSSVIASIPAGLRNIIDFSPSTLSAFPVKQGDAVIIYDTPSVGIYIINDIGPRNAEGTKPSLTASQLEIVGTFPADGSVTTRIYGSSNTVLLKGNLAPTIHQNDIKVDSIQVSRPNSARAVSLGVNPKFLDATHTLTIEVGVSPSLTRTITITDLNKNRNGIVTNPPTIDSLIERINSVFQNRVDGYAFPAAAYRIGDEFMLAHNWTDDFAYIKVTPAGNANFYLGFDDAGANIVDRHIYPTANAYYYVNGVKLHDLTRITQHNASVSGQYISFSGFDPLEAGIKIGHLVQLKTHANTNELGTYFITDVTTSTIKIHKNAGITAQASVLIEIYHDALPLDDFNTNIKDLVLEVFATANGTLGYNERLNYEDNISNLRIVDVSDNFLQSTYTLNSNISGGVATLKFAGTYEKPVFVPTTFTGTVKIPSPHNIEYVIADLKAPIGIGSSIFKFLEHIDEEDILEICSVRLDGLLTLSNIVDKRMFGTLGLDELREDVVQAYVETPAKELRSNGVINGLEVIDGYYQDPNFPLATNFYGVLIRGGTAMVDGVRVLSAITPVIFPNIAGTYIIGLDKLATFKIFDTSQYSMADLLDGYADELVLIAQIDHDGAATVPSSLVDLRFNISKIDDRVELLFDESNHFIGHFSSFDSALAYVNNYPKNEKFKIRVVSHGGSSINISSVSHSLTVVIDGQVNDVIVNASCRIISESIMARAEPHLRGSLLVSSNCGHLELANLNIANGSGQSTIAIAATGGTYRFENILFAGNAATGQLNITGTGLAERMIFDSCIFNVGSAMRISGGSIVVDNIVINDCEFYGSGTGSKIDLPANNLVINNTLFDNCGINQTLLSNPIIVDNCVFRNMTVVSAGQRIINSLSTVIVSDTKFNNIAASTADAITSSTSSDGYTRLYLDHCIFDTCSATVGSKLVSSFGAISNCIFKSITCPASPGDMVVACTDFSNNTIIGSINEFAVGAVLINNNDGLNVVKSNNFSFIQKVDGNIFGASSVFGYNIDIAATSGVEVLNNVFALGPQSAIQILSGTGEVIITNNEFLHSGACINTSLSPVKLIIDSNIIKATNLLLGSGTSNGDIIVSNNIFSNAAGFLVNGITSNIIFNSNIFLAGSLTISGSTISGLNIVNNIFNNGVLNSGITVDGNINAAIISGNSFATGSMTFNGNILNTIISDNMCSSSLALIFAAISVTTSIITNNTINMAGISAGILLDVMIVNNIIHGTDITLNIDPATSPTDYARVVFSDNTMINNINITLSSSGVISGTIIDGNIAGSANSLITVASVMNESIISANNNFSVTVSAGINSSVITDNIALNSDITLNGACNANIISGNYINDLNFTGSSASGILFSNMFINGTTVLTASGGVADKISFINNVTTGAFTVASGNSDFTRLAVNNNTFGSSITTPTIFNIHGSDISIVGNIILNSLIIWSVDGLYTLSKVNISNNTVSNDLSVCQTLTSGSAHFTNSKISGNVVNGSIKIASGVVTGATLEFSKNTISENFCNFQISMFNPSTHGIITFSENSFLNNRATDNLLFLGSNIASPDILIQKTIISGNSVNAFVFGQFLTYSELIISSNRFSNTGTSMLFDIGANSLPGQFDNLNISNNIMNAKVLFNIHSAVSTIIDGLIFNNNLLKNNDFRLSYVGSSTLDLTAREWIFNGNVMRAIILRSDEGTGINSILNIESSSFSNNAFSGNVVTISSVSTNPGIFISKGTNNGGLTMNCVALDRNFYGGDATVAANVQFKFVTNHSANTATPNNAFVISNSSISGNKNIDIIYQATGSSSTAGFFTINALIMNDNVFIYDQNVIRGITLSSINNTVTNISEITISGNKGGQISLTSVNQIISSVLTNNFLDLGDEFIPTFGDMTINCQEFVSILLIGNRSRFYNFTGPGGIGLALHSNLAVDVNITSTSGISDVVCSTNRIIGNLVIDGSTSSSSVGININSNSIYGNIIIEDFNKLSNTNINNNLLNNFLLSATQNIQIENISTSTDGTIISNNQVTGSISFINMAASNDSNTNIIIKSNYCNSLSLIGFTGSSSINWLNMANNIVQGIIALPNRSVFSSGSKQSLLSFNFADHFTSPTVFTTALNASVFVWGNYSLNTSTGVNFTGTTATNVTTANSINGGGITC